MSVDNINDNESPPIQVENSNLNQKKNDNVYHAIYVPSYSHSNNTIEEPLHVYTNKIEALRVIKKHPTGRLKSFKSVSEAEQYAKHGPQDTNGANIKIPTITITCEEKASSFKGPKSQELVAFRKIIESGDLETVKRIVWENPRYLISSGDTPAILQEGCRYNALHIASSKGSKNAEMCKLILDTVSDTEFVGLLYGKDESKTYVNRAQILLDLYLNTPDKGLNETPLHFAAKYGLKDVVKLLVSYSECVKTLKNKYEQTPLEIVCSRKCQDDEFLKRDIKMFLQDQYYVPVLRSEDGTIQPEIGLPFSPTSPPSLNINPISPRVKVRAFAGPMTKPQAMEFRKKWKTPPRMYGTPTKRDISLNDSYSSLTSPRSRDADVMRLKDTEKGLERVGRDLAEECSVAWKEFWPFLNDFADLRTSEGLDMLEKYLMQRITVVKKVSGLNEESPKLHENPKANENRNIKTDNSKRKSLMSDFVNELDNMWGKLQADKSMSPEKSFDEMESLIKKMEQCSLDKSFSPNSELDDQFYTPPDTPELLLSDESDNESSEDEMFFAEEGKAVFIEGEVPGKVDFDVLNAIPEVIDSNDYPFIYKWRHEMKLADLRNHYTSFRTPRRRLLMTPEK